MQPRAVRRWPPTPNVICASIPHRFYAPQAESEVKCPEIELNQLRERAMKDIDAAKRAAFSEIYGYSTTLATAMASKILRRTVNPGDTQQLVEESMAQLQAAAKG